MSEQWPSKIPPAHPPVSDTTKDLSKYLPAAEIVASQTVAPPTRRRLLGWDTAPILMTQGIALGAGVNLALHWYSLGVPMTGIGIELGAFLGLNTLGYFTLRHYYRREE